MWNLGQEMKVSLSPVNVMQNPGSESTNLYMVIMGIRSVSNGNYYLNSCAKQADGGNSDVLADTCDIPTPVAPVTFKMVLKIDTSFLCYTNDVLFGMINSATPAFFINGFVPVLPPLFYNERLNQHNRLTTINWFAIILKNRNYITEKKSKVKKRYRIRSRIDWQKGAIYVTVLTF